MRAVLAIAAILAAPVTATADEQTPTPAPVAPAPAPALPAPSDGGGAPSETPATAPQPEQPVDGPTGDPAYGEHPERDTHSFPAPKGKDVVIVSYPERSKTNVATIAGLAIGGVLVGAVGLYFHMDSRSASDEVSAHRFTGEPWTAEHQDSYDRAHSSAVAAGVLYGIGGGLLLASAIVYMATESEPETMVIHPHSAPARARALVAPTNGGAIVGGAWRF
jgi:hypothetical protein